MHKYVNLSLWVCPRHQCPFCCDQRYRHSRRPFAHNCEESGSVPRHWFWTRYPLCRCGWWYFLCLTLQQGMQVIRSQTKQLKIEVINNGAIFMVSWNFKVDASRKSFSATLKCCFKPNVYCIFTLSDLQIFLCNLDDFATCSCIHLHSIWN